MAVGRRQGVDLAAGHGREDGILARGEGDDAAALDAPAAPQRRRRQVSLRQRRVLGQRICPPKGPARRIDGDELVEGRDDEMAGDHDGQAVPFAELALPQELSRVGRAALDAVERQRAAVGVASRGEVEQALGQAGHVEMLDAAMGHAGVDLPAAHQRRIRGEGLPPPLLQRLGGESARDRRGLGRERVGEGGQLVGHLPRVGHLEPAEQCLLGALAVRELADEGRQLLGGLRDDEGLADAGLLVGIDLAAVLADETCNLSARKRPALDAQAARRAQPRERIALDDGLAGRDGILPPPLSLVEASQRELGVGGVAGRRGVPNGLGQRARIADGAVRREQTPPRPPHGLLAQRLRGGELKRLLQERDGLAVAATVRLVRAVGEWDGGMAGLRLAAGLEPLTRLAPVLEGLDAIARRHQQPAAGDDEIPRPLVLLPHPGHREPAVGGADRQEAVARGDEQLPGT